MDEETFYRIKRKRKIKQDGKVFTSILKENLFILL